jgi:hypothetical protein
MAVSNLRLFRPDGVGGRQSGDSIALTWGSMPGYAYQIQFKTNLTAVN